MPSGKCVVNKIVIKYRIQNALLIGTWNDIKTIVSEVHKTVRLFEATTYFRGMCPYATVFSIFVFLIIFFYKNKCSPPMKA